MMTNERLEELRKSAGNYSREEIVEICLNRLKRESYIFLADLFPKTSKAIIDRAVYDITKSGKYMLDLSPNEKLWIIKRDPHYKNQLLHDIKIAIIAALLSLTTGYILWKVDTRSENQELRQLKEQLKQVSDRTDSLQRR